MDKKRLEILQSRLKHPLLIKKKENLFYLTGYSFMNGYLLVKKNYAVFFGDGLEKVEGIKKTDRLKYIGKYLRRGGTLQIEDEFTFAESKYLKEKLRGVRLKHLKSPVDYLRTVKEVAELANISDAMQIGQKVFGVLRRKLKFRSWTELELALEIRRLGHRFGAEDVSFPPIVASGANAAIPHHVSGNKKLRLGESVILDFGFKYRGYCSDFTRTVFLRTAPKRMAEAYGQTERAYLGVLSKAHPGIKAKGLYELAMRILEKKHLGKYFIHNLGHGTGLEIHELPNLSQNSKDILQKGMVFSIEPGVYIPKHGGIRIEDLVYLPHGESPIVKKFISVPTSLKENIIR